MILAPILLTLAAAPSSLTFAEAEARADAVPSLAGLRAALTEQRAAADRVGTVPFNPVVTFAPGYRVAPGPERGFEWQASLVQGFSLAGWGRSRLNALDEEASALAGTFGQERYLRRRVVAELWIDAWGAQQALEAGEASLRSATELRIALEKAEAARAITRAEMAQARGW